MNSTLIIILSLLHLLGDSGLQTTDMVNNKTHNPIILVKHTLTYTLSIIIPLIVFHHINAFNLSCCSDYMFYIKIIITFFILNFGHMITDYFMGLMLEKSVD